MNPHILVLMSTYNGVQSLKGQLDSIRMLENVTIRLLIRDDGSTDGTVPFINNYKLQYPEFDMDLILGENVGFAQSFTLLLKAAYTESEKGVVYDYYAFSDQDDIWLPGKLSAAAVRLSAIPNRDVPNVYCSNTNLVDSNLVFLRLMNPVGSVKMSRESFLLRNIAVGCTMVFNFNALRYYTVYTPQYIRVHDYVMFLIGVFLGNFVYDDTPYINYRQHGNNQIGIAMSFGARMNKRLKRIVRKERGIQERTINSFLDAYKCFLDIDSIYLMSQVAFYKRNVWSRLSLLFSKKFTLDALEKTFFVKLKILLGSL